MGHHVVKMHFNSAGHAVRLACQMPEENAEGTVYIPVYDGPVPPSDEVRNMAIAKCREYTSAAAAARITKERDGQAAQLLDGICGRGVK